VGAETSAAHPNAELVAQDGGGEEVRGGGELQGDDPQALGGMPRVAVAVDFHLGDACQAFQGIGGQLGFVVGDGVHADLAELA
jgi:hypothetical protein